MNRTKRDIFVLFTFVALFSLLIAACGDDDDEGDNGNGESPAATATTAAGGDEAETPEGDEAETPEGDEAETPEGDEAETPEDDEGETPEGEETAATGGAVTGDAAAGEAIYEAQCASCHTIDGSDGVGPTWQGLWMSEVPLEDGSTVTADEEYITESIQDPSAKVHEGFQPVMPEFDLSDEDIANVIAFIQTLE